jgi:hypothetical protein
MNTNTHEFTKLVCFANYSDWCCFVVKLARRLEKSGVEDRPQMDDPPEQDKPEDCRQTKLDDRHHQSALKQLPQAGDEETAECGENVTRRTLASHAFDLMSGCKNDKSFSLGSVG